MKTPNSAGKRISGLRKKPEKKTHKVWELEDLDEVTTQRRRANVDLVGTKTRNTSTTEIGTSPSF